MGPLRLVKTVGIRIGEKCDHSSYVRKFETLSGLVLDIFNAKILNRKICFEFGSLRIQAKLLFFTISLNWERSISEPKFRPACFFYNVPNPS